MPTDPIYLAYADALKRDIEIGDGRPDLAKPVTASIKNTRRVEKHGTAPGGTGG